MINGRPPYDEMGLQQNFSEAQIFALCPIVQKDVLNFKQWDCVNNENGLNCRGLFFLIYADSDNEKILISLIYF